MRLFALIPTFLLIPLALMAQGRFLGTGDDTKRHADQVISQLARSDQEGMFASLSMFWHGSDEEFASLRKSILRWYPELTSSYGSVIDQHYVSVQKFGSWLLRHVFILRFQRQPVRLHVSYYQSTKGWILLGLDIETDIRRILDQDGIEQKPPPPAPNILPLPRSAKPKN